MVLSKEITVRISESNYAYYEDIGFGAAIGQSVSIPWNFLSTGSHYKILCKCDICGVEKEVMYKNYLKYQNDEPGDYTCRKCSENKRKKSLNDSYNVDYPIQNDEIMDKMKETLVDRYGVDNINKKAND
jgi:hypothetical protein